MIQIEKKDDKIVTRYAGMYSEICEEFASGLAGLIKEVPKEIKASTLARIVLMTADIVEETQGEVIRISPVLEKMMEDDADE